MPAKKQKYSEVKNIRWITVRGRRIPVKPGSDKLSAIKENVKNFQTERGGKDPAKAKNYEKSVYRPEAPHNITINDIVVFDEYTKAGQVIGTDGLNVVISSRQCPGGQARRNPEDVFKAQDLIGGDYHWDNISTNFRRKLVQKSGVDIQYAIRSWTRIPTVIQDEIKKGYGPAGHDIDAETSGIWNPVSQDEPLYKKLEDSAEDKRFDDMEGDDNTDDKKPFGGDKEGGDDQEDDKEGDKDEKGGKDAKDREGK